jgi:hypothetical protein
MEIHRLRVDIHKIRTGWREKQKRLSDVILHWCAYLSLGDCIGAPESSPPHEGGSDESESQHIWRDVPEGKAGEASPQRHLVTLRGRKKLS